MPQEMHVPIATNTAGEQRERERVSPQAHDEDLLHEYRWSLVTCGDRITAVVKQLPERRAAVRPPGLFPIDGVQRLVHEEAQGAQ